MPDTALYVVAYDISSDRERNRADKLLQGYGFRRQRSVFECRLTRGMLGRLRRDLEELMLESGFVMIYHLAPNSRPFVLGEAPPFHDDDWAWIAG